MKGPKKKNGPKRRVPKSGGKALERLRQFEQERGLAPSDARGRKRARKRPPKPTHR